MCNCIDVSVVISSPLSPVHFSVLLSVTLLAARGSALSSPLDSKNPDYYFSSPFSFFVIHLQIHSAADLWPLAASVSHFCHVWKCQHQHDMLRALPIGLKVEDTAPHFYMVMVPQIEELPVVTVWDHWQQVQALLSSVTPPWLLVFARIFRCKHCVMYAQLGIKLGNGKQWRDLHFPVVLSFYSSAAFKCA